MSGTNTTSDRPREAAGRAFWAKWGLAALVLATGGVAAMLMLRASGDATGEASAGQTLFEANCMTCHGERARGDGPLAATLPVQPPSLLEHLAHHTRAQLAQLIQTGLPPAMPPAPISPDEIHLIIDYVWTLVPESERDSLRAMQEQVETAAMPSAREFAFAGTVERVDVMAQTIAVSGDDVPGWMGPMSMTYAVNRPEVLRTLAAGDRITAKVRAGDFATLYGVERVPPP
ncbi:MAG: c-type cytochrome [Gemmatimonadetes bacterium]|nr:c-type cytochrome [Gemmatimonadota bacterium]